MDSFFGGIFKIVYVYLYFISNLIVPLPRIIKIRICTATSKSTRYVNLEPLKTLGCFFIAEFDLVFLLAISIFFHDDKLNPPFSKTSEIRTNILQWGATPADLSYLSWSSLTHMRHFFQGYLWGCSKQWIGDILSQASLRVSG